MTSIDGAGAAPTGQRALPVASGPVRTTGARFVSVLLEISIFPLGAGESVGEAVSRAVGAIRATGHDCELTAMGTLVETPTLAEGLAVVEAAHEALEREGFGRVYATVKIDTRPGPMGRLRGKVASVEARLSR